MRFSWKTPGNFAKSGNLKIPIIVKFGENCQISDFPGQLGWLEKNRFCGSKDFHIAHSKSNFGIKGKIWVTHSHNILWGAYPEGQTEGYKPSARGLSLLGPLELLYTTRFCSNWRKNHILHRNCFEWGCQKASNLKQGTLKEIWGGATEVQRKFQKFYKFYANKNHSFIEFSPLLRQMCYLFFAFSIGNY